LVFHCSKSWAKIGKIIKMKEEGRRGKANKWKDRKKKKIMEA